MTAITVTWSEETGRLKRLRNPGKKPPRERSEIAFRKLASPRVTRSATTKRWVRAFSFYNVSPKYRYNLEKSIPSVTNVSKQLRSIFVRVERKISSPRSKRNRSHKFSFLFPPVARRSSVVHVMFIDEWFFNFPHLSRPKRPPGRARCISLVAKPISTFLAIDSQFADQQSFNIGDHE